MHRGIADGGLVEGGAAHDYTIRELEPWAQFIRAQAEEGRTVYAYFNNDINTRAPDNALQLMAMVGAVTVQPRWAGAKTTLPQDREFASR